MLIKTCFVKLKIVLILFVFIYISLLILFCSTDENNNNELITYQSTTTNISKLVGYWAGTIKDREYYSSSSTYSISSNRINLEFKNDFTFKIFLHNEKFLLHGNYDYLDLMPNFTLHFSCFATLNGSATNIGSQQVSTMDKLLTDVNIDDVLGTYNSKINYYSDTDIKLNRTESFPTIDSLYLCSTCNYTEAKIVIHSFTSSWDGRLGFVAGYIGTSGLSGNGNFTGFGRFINNNATIQVFIPNESFSGTSLQASLVGVALTEDEMPSNKLPDGSVRSIVLNAKFDINSPYNLAIINLKKDITISLVNLAGSAWNFEDNAPTINWTSDEMFAYYVVNINGPYYNGQQCGMSTSNENYMSFNPELLKPGITSFVFTPATTCTPAFDVGLTSGQTISVQVWGMQNNFNYYKDYNQNGIAATNDPNISDEFLSYILIDSVAMGIKEYAHP